MSNNFSDLFQTPDHSGMYDTQDVADNKVWAALSYVGILFILPLLVNGGRSRYAKFHTNQGFILFLAELACGVASWILGWIPFIGSLCSALLSIACLVLMILGIVNGATGKAKELPLIGGLLHAFDK